MDYYNNIKTELINNEIYKKVKDYSKSRSDLKTYYNVGKLLSEAGKHYGEGIIKKYSNRLTKELGKGYGISSLKNMRKFYEIQKSQSLTGQLSWTHYCLLLTINDFDKINYYIKISEYQNLSVRQLRERIKNKEYERLDDKTKIKLINKDKTKTEDFIKNPILIKNRYDTKDISEKMLQSLILENIPSFLDELGNGYSFVRNEYPIKIGDRYNYIDLLLFNILNNHYAVVELKVTEFKAEYVGQVLKYVNYIDKNLKREGQNPTIGIIICKKGNKFVLEYVTYENIIEREYSFI